MATPVLATGSKQVSLYAYNYVGLLACRSVGLDNGHLPLPASKRLQPSTVRFITGPRLK